MTEIAERLISFDTTVAEPEDPARDEFACQEYAAELLEQAGFEVELWEPRVEDMQRHPGYLPGQHWNGRPNMVARLRGSGGGRSLLLTGHIDTVPAGELDRWTSSPWSPEVRDGKLYGRGACDMKGGDASALAAGLAIARSEVPLDGDLLIGLVTDEEVNGLGTIAMLEHGYGADAAVVPEPNELEIHVAFRGILLAELTVRGESGHVEVAQKHWSEGGGVNAIDKMRFLLDEIDRINRDWATRPDKQHPLCSPGQMLVTHIEGGNFAASIPGSCKAILDLCYVPGEGDEAGYGSRVKEEVELWLGRVADLDPWLAAHPPKIRWLVDFPAAEIRPDLDLPTAISAVLESRSLPALRTGLDTWDDTVSLIRAGIPAVSFGAGSNDQAHAVDEFVELSELRIHAGLLVQLAADWCGGVDG